jgi:predicted O-methyltransferase YrrM
MNSANLRHELPDIETQDLEQQWQEVLALLTTLDELGHPCAMGLATRQILFKTVRAMGAKTVLDIGTFTGSSALAFALAVGAGGSVVSVDIKPANAPDGNWKKYKRQHSPADLMTLAGVADRVEFVQADSVEYLQATSRRFDFICVDGWHEEQAVYAEIPLALERLNPGGLIFLDDVHPPGYIPPPGCDLITGPELALSRHLREGAPFRMVRSAPAMAFLLGGA